MKILIHRSVYGLVDEFFFVIENYFVMFLLHKKRSARMQPDTRRFWKHCLRNKRKCLQSIAMKYCQRSRDRRVFLSPGYKGWTEIKKYGKICIRNDVVKLVFEEID